MSKPTQSIEDEARRLISIARWNPTRDDALAEIATALASAAAAGHVRGFAEGVEAAARIADPPLIERKPTKLARPDPNPRAVIAAEIRAQTAKRRNGEL
jgi:hypothetical protein